MTDQSLTSSVESAECQVPAGKSPAAGEASAAATSASLFRALQEVSRVEQVLVDAGDERALSRFTDPAGGTEIAAQLGYTAVTSTEARVVNELAFLPGAADLIRAYLVGTSRRGAVDRATLRPGPPRRKAT